MDDMMQHLASQLNNYVYHAPEQDEDVVYSRKVDLALEYGQEVSKSFLRQYVAPTSQEKPHLRVSQLGKPAVLQALGLLGHTKDDAKSTKMRYIFHLGDVFEAYVVAYTKLMGWSIQRQQEEVCYLDVLGHIDGVINTPAGTAVLEFKTMSQHYFSEFTKEPNDDRGYVTQLAVYSHCLDLPAYWIVVNKGTQEVRIIQPEQDLLDEALERVKRIVPKLREVQTLEDVVTKFKAPPATEEFYRKEATGKYLVPNSMKYSPFRYAFYELERGRSKGGSYKEYVVGYHDRAESLERLSSMVVDETAEVEELLAEEVA